jgi:hypothetical protein
MNRKANTCFWKFSIIETPIGAEGQWYTNWETGPVGDEQNPVKTSG